MTSSRDDFDPIDELRAADPAQNVEPSDDFVASVLAQVSEDGSAKQENGTVANLDAERARRRPPLPWLAAGAAAALLAGAAGYGLRSIGEHVPETGNLLAQTVSASDFGRTESQATMLAGGHFQFTAGDLSQEGGSHSAYQLQAPTIDSARANALASALGISDTLEQGEYGWQILGDKVSTISFGIDSGPYGSIYYYDPEASPSTQCYQQFEEALDPPYSQSMDGQSDGGYWEQNQALIDSCLEEARVAAPSGEAAAERLVEVLNAMGLDPGNYQISGQDQTELYGDGATARGELMINGSRASLGFSLTLSADGIVSFDGMLGNLVDLGTYSTISPQEAFERLSDPRFGSPSSWTPWSDGAESATAGGTVVEAQEMATTDLAEIGETVGEPDSSAAQPTVVDPEPQSGDADSSAVQSGQSSDTDSGAAQSGVVVPPTSEPGSHPLIPWPVMDVHIVSAELGYEIQWGADNAVFLVPTYALTDSEGGTWSMVALAEEGLDFTWSE